MMKNSWLLIPLLFSVISCKKSEPDIPVQTEDSSKPSRPKPTPLEPIADQAATPKQQENATPAPATQPEQTSNTPHQPEPKLNVQPQGYPVAMPMEGQHGFVKSPYNGKAIDVRDMPPGTLVQDPSFPAAEKRYFRVP